MTRVTGRQSHHALVASVTWLQAKYYTLYFHQHTSITGSMHLGWCMVQLTVATSTFKCGIPHMLSDRNWLWCRALQVLRFYGYFQEAVTESNIENHRVRRVVLMYYLEDDSVQVTEPKQDNSGIPQVRDSSAFKHYWCCQAPTCRCILHWQAGCRTAGWSSCTNYSRAAMV